ncbi:MAG TPA: phospho-N-acetylmuramoyl-pentapeptide-transferase, partial [Ruminococcaceae bacterium]|nr:phospho-N-acetylmuramoyl-pentapeptide-transferase [Oscillospiraceae bacterium]HBT90505.1 phospho-N-acetylmuramoyl-pentapeptide-transferase [Oscillospiraceae bacterium]
MGTAWAAVAAILSFGITALFGKWLIPFLHKINFGQTIRESGPTWHRKKNGTPTMGGFLFIAGILVAVGVCLPLYYRMEGKDPLVMAMHAKIAGGLLMACGFGLIGFFDDYIKVVKKRNLGLTVRQKLVLQFLVAGGYLYSLYRAGSG